MLAALSAGVINNCTNCTTTPDSQQITSLSSNGGQSQANTAMGSNLLLLDGQDNASGAGSDWQAAIAPLDAVQQVKIITNSYDAQYGKAMGAVIETELKSGTNKLHGDVYEFARRSWMDANLWQSNYLSQSRSAHKEDQFGGELDGPIFLPRIYNGRDKAFFVLQYEELRETLPSLQLNSVPDPNWAKTGDFSNLTYFDGTAQAPVTLYDPLTTTCNVNGHCTRQPFPNNQIPPGRLNPVAQKVLSLYPAPNSTPPPQSDTFTNNYVTQIPSSNTYRNVLGKIDLNLSSADRLSLRYSYFDNFWNSSNGMPAPISNGQWPQVDTSNTVAADWVHTFSPTLVMEVMASGNRHHQWAFAGPSGFDPTTLGLPQSLVSQEGFDASFFPNFNFNGYYTGAGSGGGGAAYYYAYQLTPSLTWTKGKHTVHAGVNFSHFSYGAHTGGEWFGGQNLNFNSDTTFTQRDPSSWSSFADGGNPAASFLLGTPISGGMNLASNYRYDWPYYALYVQDDWKVTQKLTLNLGVRYDLMPGPMSPSNAGNYAFDTTDTNPVDSQVQANAAALGITIPTIKGGVTFLGVNGNPRRFYALSKSNIQPRVGFAYQLDRMTVVRGGFGEMFSASNFTNESASNFQQGYASQSNFTGSNNGGQTPFSSTIAGNDPTTGLYTLSNPFPNGLVPIAGSSNGLLTSLGQGSTYFDPRLKNPTYWSYSLGIERQFLKYDTVQFGYVGTQSHNQFDLFHTTNINMQSKAYLDACNVELGGNPNTCTGDYSNPSPFYGIAAFAGSGMDVSQTIWGGQLTQPFPAFGAIGKVDNEGKTWYNALQLTALHRVSGQLTIHGTWTWSKTMDAGWWHDQLHGVKARMLDLSDRPQRVTLSAVYQLPVGRGRKLLGNSNRIVDEAIGGWEIAPLYVFESGTPWGVPGTSAFAGGVGSGGSNVAILHNPKVNRSIDSNGYIRGVAPCVEEWIAPGGGVSADGNTTNNGTNWELATDSPAFYNWSGGCGQTNFKSAQAAPYAIEPNNIYTGVRLPNYQQFDANLSKDFSIFENLKLQLRLEAFNVLNHPLWQDGYDGNTSSPTFGEIPRGQWGQSNNPRQLQIAAKISW